jgi:glycosyltransferase involved in cell wall biosynthesis
MKKKLLWIGDAACPSGFARATHETIDVMRHTFDVTVLGINYRGDPHTYPYPIYAAAPGGDAFGLGRLIWMCDVVKPDVIVLQNDPWNIPQYLQHLKAFKEYADIPVVASIAVDGRNCRATGLNGLALGIFWTEFGLQEARAGGYTGQGVVIPLGVDISSYRPMDKPEARLRRGLPDELRDRFIVGNVNRNQPRKRWDLTVKYFATWVKKFKIEDAMLYLHTAPTGDLGVDVTQLCAYYGVLDRLLLMEPPMFYGIDEPDLVNTYNSFDLYITTTQGEGMGLTTMEAMACGIPCILPDWAALGDWAREGALMVPCSSTAVGPPYLNIIGGVADEYDFIKALHLMYCYPGIREETGLRGRTLVSKPEFRWGTIGQRFNEAVVQAAAIKEVVSV